MPNWIDYARVIPAVNTAMSAYESIQDRDTFKKDLAKIQADPTYIPDPSQYILPENGLQVVSGVQKWRDNIQKTQTQPILDQFANQYRGLTGTDNMRFLADPGSVQELQKAGLRAPDTNNPYVLQGLQEIMKQGYQDNSMSDVYGDTIASASKSPQFSTALTANKQFDEQRAKRGEQQFYNNVGGNGVAMTPALNAYYSNVPYGMPAEAIAKTADVLGLTPKLEAIEYGTGQGATKQKGAFNPRTGKIDAPIGGMFAPPEQKVSVNVPVNVKAYESERGKLGAQEAAKYQSGMQTYRENIARADGIDKMMAGIETGKYTPTTMAISQYARGLGLDIDPKLPQKEAARAMMGQFALSYKSELPGPMSDADRVFLTDVISPSLAQTSEGRKLITQTYRDIQKHKLAISRRAVAYISKNGMLDDKFYQELDDWQSNTPIFNGAKRDKNNAQTDLKSAAVAEQARRKGGK